MRATQHVEEVSLPSLSHEVESRLDKAEADFAEGKGISEAVARQHRHSFVNQLIAYGNYRPLVALFGARRFKLR